MPDHPYFTPATLGFLAELAENNRKDWFAEHRSRYEQDLREPAQRLILAMGERLDALGPSLRADPRPVGGSMFRIHRDLRFSSDKRPYKTHMGIQFRHASGKDAHAPGLYLHVEPGACFLGLGSWRPASPALRAIREALVDRSEAWREATSALAEGGLELAGESLTRMPRGFDGDHPLAEDLRRKDFIVTAPLTDGEVTDPALPDRLLSRALPAAPLYRFLCGALGIAP